jgi:hypothetical protein
MNNNGKLLSILQRALDANMWIDENAGQWSLFWLYALRYEMLKKMCMHSTKHHMLACRAIRWYVSTDMNCFRESEIGFQQTDGRFHTNIQAADDISDVDLGQLQTDLEAQLDRFTSLGSS